MAESAPTKRSSQPVTIGLTGVPASGKSEVLAAFARRGASVLSADAVVHELLASNELAAAARERFGDRVIVDGKISRPALAEAALGEPEHHGWLESTLWPRVGARIVAWIAEQCSAQPLPPAIVIEVPLLFESGMEAAFDTTIAVTADEPARTRRLAQRGHAAQAARDERQLDAAAKAAKADYVIENDGTLDDLDRKVERFLDEVRRD